MPLNSKGFDRIKSAMRRQDAARRAAQERTNAIVAAQVCELELRERWAQLGMSLADQDAKLAELEASAARGGDVGDFVPYPPNFP